MAEQTGEVIWKRRDDVAPRRARWRRFLLWFVVPGIVALVVALVLDGPGAMAGVAILLGFIGTLLAAWIHFVGLGKRINTEIRLVDGQLVCGRKRVPVDSVECWSTYRPRTSTQAGPMSGGIDGIAAFRLTADAEGRRGTSSDDRAALGEVAFVWASMTGQEFDEIRVALEPYVSAPWVPQEQFHKSRRRQAGAD